MKIKLFLSLLFVLGLAISCGKNNESTGTTSSSFSNNIQSPSTMNGYFNLNTQMIEVGSKSYQIGPQSNQQAINMAFQQAQMSQIQPVYVQGAQKLKARITGAVYNPYQYGNNNQYPQQNVLVLNVVGIQFYR
jgi:hypothetical protein